MKFLYEYRTRDNVRHKGMIRAASRDAAFAALKAQGIRPGRVLDAPGLFNLLWGRGKRWLVIGVLAVISVAAVYLAFDSNQLGLTIDSLDSEMRRQIIGDTAIIEKGVRTGWQDVFPEIGERYLAGFALPGHQPVMVRIRESDLEDALARVIPVVPSDTLESRQIKLMVEGMKKELRAYLQAGGTIRKYAMRLVRRQQEEIGYYKRAEQELISAKESKMPAAEIEKLWEKRNTELRQMGIRYVAFPE